MSNKAPIGIFDSGIGGISILKEINALMPNENCIYLADSKNSPYGNKPKEEILKLCIKNTELLLQLKCKLIVVACNTATTNAISELRAGYNVPFIGIEPAIKPAALNTRSNAIGILATKGTLSSQLFNSTSALYTSGIKVIEQVGEGIVPLIESGKLYSDEMRELLKTFLQPMINENIDYLVLGCTHYPFLIPVLNTILPGNVKIIDSGLAVARQTSAILEKLDLLNHSKTDSKITIYSNGSLDVLDSLNNGEFQTEYLSF